MKIGEIRRVPEQTLVWSIASQLSMVLAYDCPVRITHLTHDRGSTTIFAKPQYKSFNSNSYLDRGTDEWVLDYSLTSDV